MSTCLDRWSCLLDGACRYRLCSFAWRQARTRELTPNTPYRKHPSLYSKLCCTSQDRGNYLTPEHGFRRHFHVMSKFKVRSKLQCLKHSNIAPCFKKHHRYWASRKCCSSKASASLLGVKLRLVRTIAYNQLCYHVESDLLVGDCLNHADLVEKWEVSELKILQHIYRHDVDKRWREKCINELGAYVLLAAYQWSGIIQKPKQAFAWAKPVRL